MLMGKHQIYLPFCRFYWEGRSTCDEGTVEGHYDEDGGYPDRNFNTRYYQI